METLISSVNGCVYSSLVAAATLTASTVDNSWLGTKGPI